MARPAERAAWAGWYVSFTIIQPFPLAYDHRTTDLALAFSMRASSVLASSSLRKWLQTYQSHQTAQSHAAQYHSVQLQHRMLAAWRLQTRGHAQQVKVARKAEKFFVQRASWKTWAEKIAGRKRERKVKEFEQRVAQKYLRGKYLLALLAGRWVSSDRAEMLRRMARTNTERTAEEAR